jgi:hypothetical protein
MTYGIYMGALSNIQMNWAAVPPATGVAMVAILCYIAGRMQQFRKGENERAQAWMDGYNMATKSLFSLATRTSKAISAPPLLEAPVEPPKPMRGVVKVGRHSVNTGGISTLQKTKQRTAWDEYHPAA